MKDWYFYQEKGRTLGPFTADDLRARIRDGRLRLFDLIYKEGEPGWRMALEHPALRDEFKTATDFNTAERPWVCLHRKSNEGYDFLTLGPFSTEEIRDAIKAGKLSYSDFGWKEGFSEWRRLGTLVEFNPRAQGAPGAPPPTAEELLRDVVSVPRPSLPEPLSPLPEEVNGPDLTKVIVLDADVDHDEATRIAPRRALTESDDDEATRIVHRADPEATRIVPRPDPDATRIMARPDPEATRLMGHPEDLEPTRIAPRPGNPLDPDATRVVPLATREGPPPPPLPSEVRVPGESSPSIRFDQETLTQERDLSALEDGAEDSSLLTRARALWYSRPPREWLIAGGALVAVISLIAVFTTTRVRPAPEVVAPEPAAPLAIMDNKTPTELPPPAPPVPPAPPPQTAAPEASAPEASAPEAATVPTTSAPDTEASAPAVDTAKPSNTLLPPTAVAAPEPPSPPPPPPKPKPVSRAPSKLFVAERVESGGARIDVRSNGTEDYPVYLQVVGVPGQVADAPSFYRFVTLKANGNINAALDVGDLHLPAGRFILRVESGNLRKETTLSQGTGESSFKQAVARVRKQNAGAIWQERLALFRTAQDLEAALAKATPGKPLAGRGFEAVLGVRKASGQGYIFFDEWWELHDIVASARKEYAPALADRARKSRERLASLSVWRTK